MGSRVSVLWLSGCIACAAWVPAEDHPTGITARVQRTGARVVHIPAGEFPMGADGVLLAHLRAVCRRDPALALRVCLRAFASLDEPCEGALVEDARGEHRVWLGGFAMDRTEVTVGDYARCVDAGGCLEATVTPGAPLYGGSQQPAVGVSWDDAVAYCAWVGGRLPTEAEWERAARGADGRPWPWGWQWDPRRANHGAAVTVCRDASDGAAATAPVGSYPDGASPEGLLDMAGNVMEWTADAWAPETAAYPPADPTARLVAPRGARHGADRMVRGGAWDTPTFTQSTVWRGHRAAGERALDLGFRCVWDG